MPTIRQFTRSHSRQSEDGDYFNQNQPQNHINQRRNHWNNIDLPNDFFQPHTFKPVKNPQ